MKNLAVHFHHTVARAPPIIPIFPLHLGLISTAAVYPQLPHMQVVDLDSGEDIMLKSSAAARYEHQCLDRQHIHLSFNHIA